jgi:V-ATPase subunit C
VLKIGVGVNQFDREGCLTWWLGGELGPAPPSSTSSASPSPSTVGSVYKTLLNMPSSSRFLLISLPASISSSQDKDDALAALKATVSPDNGTTYPFPIPAFKIGTLDALVQQADDLAKLNASCEAVVSKVAESLKTILDGDEDKAAQQKTINDSRFCLRYLAIGKES